MRRLREIVRELERSLSEREVNEGREGAGGAEGGVVAATVRVNGFFVVSATALMAAMMGMQAVRPQWMGGG